MRNPPLSRNKIRGAVHVARPHDSAAKQVAGDAFYIDDIPEPKDLLHLYLAQSEKAHARLLKLDVSAVRAAPGVVAVLTAADVPGVNDASPIEGDDPVFAEDIIEYAGQVLFAVAAETLDQARAAAKHAIVEYEELPAIVTIEQALAANSFVLPTREIRRGDAAAAIKAAKHRLKQKFEIGGQDHFYLEGHVALALPGEDGDIFVHSSTQHPTEVQHNVAKFLDLPDHSVIVEIRRMGGGFGGKETQGAWFAAIAALTAKVTGRPAKIRLDRDDDMIITGKRHDFIATVEMGFDDDGMVSGAEFVLASRCGRSADLSASINDRAMFHADNCYYFDNVTIISHRCKTHTVSNTAFRGFGGPQGMLAPERMMDAIASYLGKDPLEVRKANLYGKDKRNVTPYKMTVEDNIAPEIIAELEKSSDYAARRNAIRAFNKKSSYLKKGISLTPVKFGISFTASHLNQAGALLHVYTDGSVMINHGGTEMGQGLYIKVAQVVAEIFQIDIERVKITATRTDKVPNTSPTAASSGADLNGKAAEAAALAIKERLVAFAAKNYGVDKSEVVFLPNRVKIREQTVAFKDLVQLAYMNRVSLSSTGYYRTPKIHYDAATLSGRPFYYFAYGAAVSEVIVDTLTGENKVVAVDILHDTGKSLNPAIDLGQIEGGYIQGMGWLTTEELYYDDKGILKTHAPSTYKIPACSDRPEKFKMKIFERGENVEETIFRSKAVGEPPLMLAISAFNAIADAISSIADYRLYPDLDAPATPERILKAAQRIAEAVNNDKPAEAAQ
ncbi:xanthine dehydrogenase molybdopterin binding subunit [Sneathiella chungangensis]|uniref:Xanthine dehydrogenase molybdopterin binding subunit n=1 Tax=Sneathiella chungangensis TaxID=1418234 RepID=A0A845MEB5_9PROT|nr:xanthine dehydrogenase molybdopterin binding subunit [Sneathiella chungangensis]MZR21952.1 xanthine dehydrogenase molybdopterin binding subunit [Sneathiella chungangensis]